jgi:hypothetical protein
MVMSYRDDETGASSDVRHAGSPEEFGAGAMLTGILGAFLVVGIVVYSIVNMNEVKRAPISPLPPKLNIETTGQGAAVPILPPNPPNKQLLPQ